MIVCKRCGHRNADGAQFCEACRAYLEFHGAEEAPKPAPTPSSTVAVATPVPAAAEPAAAEPAARPPEEAAPPPKPSPPQPVVDRGIEPGDLICGQCGAGNRPERRFCRRCGASLVDARRARIPWYRRLARALPHRRRLEAGQRPRRLLPAGFWGRVLRAGRNVVAVGLLLGVVALAIDPSLRAAAVDRVDVARKLAIGHPTPVHPIAASATSSLLDHPASMTIDNFKNTYWAADLRRDRQPELTLTFDRQIDIYDELFTPGVPGDYLAQARPRDMEVTFSDGVVHRVTLRDEANGQQTSLLAQHVTSVRIHILSVYPSPRGPGMALSKVELFTRT